MACPASRAGARYTVWYAGKDDIAAFLPIGPLRERWRLVPVGANGQFAFGCCRWDATDSRFVGRSIDVLSLRDDRVARHGGRPVASVGLMLVGVASLLLARVAVDGAVGPILAALVLFGPGLGAVFVVRGPGGPVLYPAGHSFFLTKVRAW